MRTRDGLDCLPPSCLQERGPLGRDAASGQVNWFPVSEEVQVFEGIGLASMAVIQSLGLVSLEVIECLRRPSLEVIEGLGRPSLEVIENSGQPL